MGRLRRSSKLQGMFSRLPPPWREKTKKETKANSPETTKNLLSNAQPNTSNTVINSCYLLFSIYFLSTCYRQCINLSYRSLPLLSRQTFKDVHKRVKSTQQKQPDLWYLEK